MHLRHIRERTRSVLGGIPTRSVGTISVISGTPIMPMFVLSVIPESCCDHGLWEAACELIYNDERPSVVTPPRTLRVRSRM